MIKQVDVKGRHERKSRSAVILSIPEECFERKKHVDEILVGLGVLSHVNLSKGLELQKTRFAEKFLGDALLEEELVTPDGVKRALIIQGRRRQLTERVSV